MATIKDGIYFIGIPYTDNVLDVKGNSKEKGTEIISYKKHRGDNQRWNICLDKDKRYRITGVSSKMVMETKGAKTKDSGTMVEIGDDNDKKKPTMGYKTKE